MVIFQNQEISKTLIFPKLMYSLIEVLKKLIEMFLVNIFHFKPKIGIKNYPLHFWDTTILGSSDKMCFNHKSYFSFDKLRKHN